MAESSIQRARRRAREKRERKTTRKQVARHVGPKKPAKGFFSSFLDRGDTIDAAVEGARARQSTDKANQ